MDIFNLPDLGEGLAEAEIVAWHVAEGDTVSMGQLLVSVETAKAVVDIPSPCAGKIRRLHGSPGQVLKVGHPLVEFGETAIDTGTVVGVVSGETQQLKEETILIGKHRSPEHQHTRVRRSAASARDKTTEPTETPPAWEDLHGLRRQMALNLTKAQAEVALVTIFDEARLRWKTGTRPLDRLVRALLIACRQEPALNAWYRQDTLQRHLHSSVHMGLAVDTPDGLLVPVISNIDQMSMTELPPRLADLKARAMERSLSSDELQGATITLSSFGMIGGLYATPMVTPPQVAIIGAGRIVDRPRIKGKQIKSDRMLPISLSFDHRAVTGGEAARFLHALITDLGKKE